MKKDITALFCFVDDFCNISEQWINKSFNPKIIDKWKSKGRTLLISKY